MEIRSLNAFGRIRQYRQANRIVDNLFDLDIELLISDSSIRAYRNVNGERSRAVNSVAMKKN